MRAKLVLICVVVMMCAKGTTSETLWRELPKAELHLHLGGAYPLDYLLSVAEPAQRTSLQTEMERLGKGLLSYHEAFAVFDLIRMIVNSEERVEGGAEALCRSLEQDGVVYAEIRTGLRDFGRGYEEYLKAILRGIEKGCSDKLQVKLLLSLRRDSSLEYAQATAKLAANYRSQGVVGIDISGDSTVGAIQTILPELVRMKEEGFFLTLHLGESPLERGQLELLEALRPDRVGHGVHLEPEARAWILQHRVPLEVCLTSGVLAQMIDEPANHPGLQDFKQGHPVVICTDDPLIFQTSLSQEYDVLFRAIPITVDEMKRLAAASIDYAFTGPEEKQRLKDLMSFN